MSSGQVGIGTPTPTQALLVVNGTQDSNLTYGYLDNTGATGTGSGINSYSIYASSRIAATEFNAYSDVRIKHITGPTNNTNDLTTLAQIQITNYRFIDTLEKGTGVSKKVIAQQLETVYPQAVSKLTDAVPDVYKAGTIHAGKVTVAHKLKEGDFVKLIFTNRTEVMKILAAGDGWFTVNANDEGAVFVYGKIVDDFRAVDYEALTTLNISATQELLKRITQLESENNSLKNEVQEIKTGKADAGDVQQLKLQLEELKLLMQQNGLQSKH